MISVSPIIKEYTNDLFWHFHRVSCLFGSSSKNTQSNSSYYPTHCGILIRHFLVTHTWFTHFKLHASVCNTWLSESCWDNSGNIIDNIGWSSYHWNINIGGYVGQMTNKQFKYRKNKYIIYYVDLEIASTLLSENNDIFIS